jgi:neutral amino acid transport system ATP-binding protein
MLKPFKGNLLSVSDLRKSFGGVHAVDGATFDVKEGSITGLIGPNGAGKSTVVNSISGFHRADSGTIHLAGTDISRYAPHQTASLGLIRTFQIARELQKLTVLENLMLAPHGQVGETPWAALFSRRKIREAEELYLRKALAWLSRFNLLPLRDEYAGNLSGGQKKLLELARALMASPRLVLLDEPMAGVNPSLALTLEEHIRTLQKQGITFLLIEHNLSVVEAICDHVIVMAEGKVLAQGNMNTLRENESVVAAYLGG